ncbi:uncharacterized protein LOC141677085 [Apium graveolens]|uniref:uncharacterized protein LOC141677085 n=1 Tax=Apium graveolens TaxID=4045 RepID=UPI003D7919F8
MQSYIGVLARTKAPIVCASWKLVPQEKKNKIWDCVKMAYEVPPLAQKLVLSSTCRKWREFKCNLTTKYIMPYAHEPEILKHPPADYSFIERAHWEMFVAKRTTAEFLELHDTQSKRRELNKYNHRMSRKGYANLEQEMIESDPSMEIDRSDAWIRA